jgi:hypothetical protein
VALLRSYEDEDYDCSHSTMLVTDSWEYEDGANDPFAGESPWLTPDGSEGGTFVVAGVGWMNITAAGDEYHRVRLEAHDSAPPLDLSGWGDVAETPYGSGTGWVGTGTLFGDEDEPHLQLGAPGRYRVRVSRREAVDSGDEFLLQFWPAVDQPGPRHLARDPRPESAYWREASDFVGADLRAHIWWTGLGAGSFSVRELAAHTLLPVAGVVAALREEEREGRLVIDGDVEDPDAVLGLRLAGGPSRFDETPVEGPAEDGDDAEADEDECGEDWGEDQDDFVPDGWAGEWFGGGDGDEVPAEHEGGHGTVEVSSTWVVVGPTGRPPRPPAPPWGPPPLAGYVSSLGQLVLWGAEGPAVHAELGARRTGRRTRHGTARQAFQTAAGTLVVTAEEALLVRLGGEVEVLVPSEVSEAAVDVTGSAVGIVQHHRGRRPWTALHWVDLSSGERRSWLWSATDDWMRLVGLVDGAMLLNHELEPESGGPTVRWVPGSPPERLPWHVASLDPWTGTLTRWRGEDGTVLREETSARHRVSVPLPRGAPGQLGPGARMLFGVDDENFGRPRLTVLDPDAGEPRVIPLPADVDIHNHHGCTYVWETPNLLLMGLRPGRAALGCAAIRVDAVDATIERVDLGSWAEEWGTVVFVRPLIR